ncbi:hypothetical protein [Alicyclobacillus shizuokensis]|uniref:hypothetical protein n=1 Tax=Alicyclobacillus shizuokensis TaxID=392014 RepID=UPI00083098BF|nr:hypothetical protein [Alicyclobacillus shizuokensis]
MIRRFSEGQRVRITEGSIRAPGCTGVVTWVGVLACDVQVDLGGGFFRTVTVWQRYLEPIGETEAVKS